MDKQLPVTYSPSRSREPPRRSASWRKNSPFEGRFTWAQSAALKRPRAFRAAALITAQSCRWVSRRRHRKALHRWKPRKNTNIQMGGGDRRYGECRGSFRYKPNNICRRIRDVAWNIRSGSNGRAWVPTAGLFGRTARCFDRALPFSKE